jgi:hypothetical protein
MRFFSIFLCTMALAVTARADEAHLKAMTQVIESWAKMDKVYLAVHGKKAPLKDLETALGAGVAEHKAAAATAGLSAEASREIQSCVATLEKTAWLMSKDTGEDDPRFYRAGDDLAELSRIARTLAGSVAPAGKLTSAERKQLWTLVEERFGKKTLEYPRGDTSPFSANSRAPFASAMWILLTAFDDSVKRDAPAKG